MGNNQHLKRHKAPTSWPIKRKNITFIAKPNSGSHKLKYVISIVVLFRDILKYAKTSKEVKLIVNNETILVNGKKITDIKTAVGLFDTLEIKKTNEKYIMIFDNLGKIKLIKTSNDFVYLRISNKTVLGTNRFQLNFMNGFNIIIDEKTFKNSKTQDTIVFDFKNKKITKIVPLKENVFVYIFDGKFKGQFGKINSFNLNKGLTKDTVEITIDNNVQNTAKEYCFALTNKKEDLKQFM